VLPILVGTDRPGRHQQGPSESSVVYLDVYYKSNMCVSKAFCRASIYMYAHTNTETQTQTDRQTDKHTHEHTHTHTCNLRQETKIGAVTGLRPGRPLHGHCFLIKPLSLFKVPKCSSPAATGPTGFGSCPKMPWVCTQSRGSVCNTPPRGRGFGGRETSLGNDVHDGGVQGASRVSK